MKTRIIPLERNEVERNGQRTPEAQFGAYSRGAIREAKPEERKNYTGTAGKRLRLEKTSSIPELFINSCKKGTLALFVQICTVPKWNWNLLNV
jgi:hypothetical protein